MSSTGTESNIVIVDVAIAGGGLAGLCLARQLRRSAPELSIAVLEARSASAPEACHKVGESSVELGSHYLAEVLGLSDYLNERHLIKNGLRFFPGQGDSPLASRVEIGPPQLPIVPSFQIDRGRFENDLIAMEEEEGLTVLGGFRVSEVNLDGERHTVTAAHGGKVQCRYFVDATGRRQLLRRQLGLSKDNRHEGNAAWFRVKGRIDVAELVPKDNAAWQRRDPDHIRWLSTVHLMGDGYWVWIIPLASGYTSIGIVADAKKHPFDRYRKEPLARAWIEEKEPALHDRIKDVMAEDFGCLNNYSHTSTKVFSEKRWFITGEAGSFIDPFYSPGTDFIALSNCFITELITGDTELETEGSGSSANAFSSRARKLSDWFLYFVEESMPTFRDMSHVYGQPRVMAAKIYWDNVHYWSFLCQYFIQGIYRETPDEQAPILRLGAKFAALHRQAQAFFSAWAEHAEPPESSRPVTLPPIPSALASLHLDLAARWSLSETETQLERTLAQAQGILAELVVRGLSEMGANDADSVARMLEIESWDLPISEERLVAEDLRGATRRRALSKLARDISRCLGRTEPSCRGEMSLAARHANLSVR